MSSPNGHREYEEVDGRESRRLARMLFWVVLGVGVAAVGATVAYVGVRMTAAERLEDPTTQRIQDLIDEANSLLKALDDQRHSA